MKLATTALLAVSLMVVGIGCEERTGSPIDGGDPAPERLDQEPPYAPETTEPGVPQQPGEAESTPEDSGSL